MVPYIPLTCRQIRREVLAFILEDVIVLWSLERLVKWTERNSSQFLTLVRDVHIRLDLESFSSIARSSRLLGEPSEFEPGTGSWWESRYRQFLAIHPQRPVESTPAHMISISTQVSSCPPGLLSALSTPQKLSCCASNTIMHHKTPKSSNG